MSRRTAVVVLVLAVLTAAIGLAACGGDSSTGGITVGGAATSPSPASSSPSASASPSASPTGGSSPLASPTSGGGTAAGDLTADEFTTYADGVKPWYDQIIKAGGQISYLLVQVDSNEISEGQAAARIQKQLYKLDPPVEELASMTVPSALDAAHHAWLDAISYEAQAYQRDVDLLSAGRYQRASTDSQVEALEQKSADAWSKWRETLQQFEQQLRVNVPWEWPQ